MDMWINVIGTITQVIIAGGVLFFIYIINIDKISSWFSVKKITGRFLFNVQKEKAGFQIILENKGRFVKRLDSICNENDIDITRFFGLDRFDGVGLVLYSKEVFYIQLTVGPSLLGLLEMSNAIFFKCGDRKKIISFKKDIQRELKKYREHIEKSKKNS